MASFLDKTTKHQPWAGVLNHSGRRESNSVILLPKQTYYRYTTARRVATLPQFQKITPLRASREFQRTGDSLLPRLG